MVTRITLWFRIFALASLIGNAALPIHAAVNADLDVRIKLHGVGACETSFLELRWMPDNHHIAYIAPVSGSFDGIDTTATEFNAYQDGTKYFILYGVGGELGRFTVPESSDGTAREVGLIEVSLCGSDSKTFTINIHHITEPGSVGNSAVNCIGVMSHTGDSDTQINRSVAPDATGEMVFTMATGGSYTFSVGASIQKINPPDHPTAPNVIVPSFTQLFYETYTRSTTDQTRDTYIKTGTKPLRDWVVEGSGYNPNAGTSPNTSTGNNNTNTAIQSPQTGVGTSRMPTNDYSGGATNLTGITRNIGNANANANAANGEILGQIEQDLQNIHLTTRGGTNLLGGIYGNSRYLTNLVRLGSNSGGLNLSDLSNGIPGYTSGDITTRRGAVSTQTGELTDHKDGFTALGDGIGSFDGGSSPFSTVSFAGLDIDLNPFHISAIGDGASAARTFTMYCLAIIFLIYASHYCFEAVAAGMRTPNAVSASGGAIPGVSSAVGCAVGVAVVIASAVLLAALVSFVITKPFLGAINSGALGGTMAGGLYIADQMFPVDMALTIAIVTITMHSLGGVAKLTIAYFIKSVSL